MTATPLLRKPTGKLAFAYQTITALEQARADLEAEVRQWKSVFDHLGSADECGNEWIKLQDENQRLREAFDSLAERFSNMDANGDKWISTVAAAAMTLHALEKQP